MSGRTNRDTNAGLIALREPLKWSVAKKRRQKHDLLGGSNNDTTGGQVGLTTGCIVYTNIQPVVKPV